MPFIGPQVPVVPDQALRASRLTPFQAVLAGDVSAVDTHSFYESFSRNLPHAVAANENGNVPENARDFQIADPALSFTERTVLDESGAFPVPDFFAGIGVRALSSWCSVETQALLQQGFLMVKMHEFILVILS